MHEGETYEEIILEYTEQLSLDNVKHEIWSYAKSEGLHGFLDVMPEREVSKPYMAALACLFDTDMDTVETAWLSLCELDPSVNRLYEANAVCRMWSGM